MFMDYKQAAIWLLVVAAMIFIAIHCNRYLHHLKLPTRVRLSLQPQITIEEYTNPSSVRDKENPTVECLRNLIEIDGAGAWPPRSSYGKAWPIALQSYHAIYLELSTLISSEELSADDTVNFQRCLNFRIKMGQMLYKRIIIIDVEVSLSEKEGKMTGDVWNGFFACIALLRHAFRWGTNPVVKYAQEELIVQFPTELEIPWLYLKHRYGITSQGGNVTSNYLCNFDKESKLVYPINVGMSEIIMSTEYNFAHVFPAVETQALPVYHMITKCITEYSDGNHTAVLECLTQINTLIRHPLKTYFNTMVDDKIPRKFWMQYAQGFQGWGVGEIDPVTGNYVKFDGLSGNQLLFCHIIDAFLGLNTYLSDENARRYVPKLQRKFRESVQKHSFREQALLCGDKEIEKEMLGIVRQMRVFRTAHKVRVKGYLNAPAPERLIMTAGKSVLETEEIHEVDVAIAPLEDMLASRLAETR